MAWEDVLLGGGFALAGGAVQQWGATRQHRRERKDRRQQSERESFVELITVARRIQNALRDLHYDSTDQSAIAALRIGRDHLTEAVAVIRLIVHDETTVAAAVAFEDRAKAHADGVRRGRDPDEDQRLQISSLIDTLQAYESKQRI